MSRPRHRGFWRGVGGGFAAQETILSVGEAVVTVAVEAATGAASTSTVAVLLAATA